MIFCFKEIIRGIYDNFLVWIFFSEKLEAIIPIRFLLNIVEFRPEEYRAIRSPLMRFCGLYYSYMMPTVDSLLLSMQDELKVPQRKVKRLFFRKQAYEYFVICSFFWKKVMVTCNLILFLQTKLLMSLLDVILFH